MSTNGAVAMNDVMAHTVMPLSRQVLSTDYPQHVHSLSTGTADTDCSAAADAAQNSALLRRPL